MGIFGMKYQDRLEVEKMINEAADKKNPTKKITKFFINLTQRNIITLQIMFQKIS